MGSSPEVVPATEADLPRLFEVWEASVRATHLFLGDSDIQALIPFVRTGLASFPRLYCVRREGRVVAFLGVADSKIEMLFVHPDHRGRGTGRTLTEHAIRSLGARRVDVNEQNPGAVGFYEHFGFHIVGRSERDPLGNPFPILHMELA